MEDMNVGYSGKVIVKKYKKGKLKSIKTLKNKGAWNLFHLICSLLKEGTSGEDISELPRRLDVCVGDPLTSTGIIANPQFILKVPIISTPTIDTETIDALGSCDLTFEFYIYYSNINAIIDSTEKAYFVLRSRSNFQGENDLIYASVDSDIASMDFKLAEDEVMVVKWVLSIGNKPEDELQQQ